MIYVDSYGLKENSGELLRIFDFVFRVVYIYPIAFKEVYTVRLNK